ncbi:hypothetical protein XSR1_10261 [Xenorhabdus szentirmaii DSM 16338]|uniref:Uncharacterized protein n=1 Tax=Xenorhabdus szentirmaii DSM 16338 TaxID=1427518 RepID=W1IT57_9GAMM|nr:hypothetical protein XSR1_10261 [Xenorhabdus szentirmaii DSM 16338]
MAFNLLNNSLIRGTRCCIILHISRHFASLKTVKAIHQHQKRLIQNTTFISDFSTKNFLLNIFAMISTKLFIDIFYPY